VLVDGDKPASLKPIFIQAKYQVQRKLLVENGKKVKIIKGELERGDL
jgi:hypothetical protein